MLQRISTFLRSLFQGLRPASFPHAEQVQSICKQGLSTRHSITISEKNLKETGPVLAIPQLGQERITEPCRAVVRLKRPAERYRKLDAMLAEIKQDRLQNTETLLLPVPARKLANRLHRELEQDKRN